MFLCVGCAFPAQSQSVLACRFVPSEFVICIAMGKKLAELVSSVRKGYNWQYCSLGGVTRVNITSGEDVAHLPELDKKLWTVLSCPVKGLEMDERTLSMMDTDHDGKLRVDEVVEASKWLCRVLVSPDLLLREEDRVSLSDLNSADAEGARLREALEAILRVTASDRDFLTLAELDAYYADYLKRRQKTQEERLAALPVVNRPYGDSTDEALAAVEALKAKVADYFTRCKFVQFHDDCRSALDVSVEDVTAISVKNLSDSAEEIAKYPLARPQADGLLPLGGGINPAWQSRFAAAKRLALDADFPGRQSLSEEEWLSVVAKVEAYRDDVAKLLASEKEAFEASTKNEDALILELEKLIRLKRDFFRLLHNYVMVSDFYDSERLAIFQAGKLYIDSRCCNLCLRVDGQDDQANMARLSGMYLIYCDCVSRVKNTTMQIVAVMTDGDIDNLRVGKNAIFYDRSGLDWDATVTKIVDNPISIRQAFWSPYRKFWNWCTEKLNKSAAEKESKAFSNMTEKATSTFAVQPKLTPEQKQTEASKKQAFDIAKFAGIFAAIGLAVGYIAGAVTKIAGLLFSSPLNFLIFFSLIILSISGPSMFIAWSKLHKRNLGPVLNANGWAINAKVLVNVRFGSTLTEMAAFPKLVLEDPYAVKPMPAWKRWTLAVSLAVVAAFCSLFFTNTLASVGLPFHREESVIGSIIDSTKSAVVKSMQAVVPDSSATAALAAQPALPSE